MDTEEKKPSHYQRYRDTHLKNSIIYRNKPENRIKNLKDQFNKMVKKYNEKHGIDISVIKKTILNELIN